MAALFYLAFHFLVAEERERESRMDEWRSCSGALGGRSHGGTFSQAGLSIRKKISKRLGDLTSG